MASSSIGDLIAVGLLSQKDGLGLTANEAHRIGDEIAKHLPISDVELSSLLGEAKHPRELILLMFALRPGVSGGEIRTIERLLDDMLARDRAEQLKVEHA